MNIDMIKKEFREILEYEKRAKYFYDHYIDQMDDEEMKDKLITVRDEEKIHIRMVERLIGIVS